MDFPLAFIEAHEVRSFSVFAFPVLRLGVGYGFIVPVPRLERILNSGELHGGERVVFLLLPYKPSVSIHHFYRLSDEDFQSRVLGFK